MAVSGRRSKPVARSMNANRQLRRSVHVLLKDVAPVTWVIFYKMS